MSGGRQLAVVLGVVLAGLLAGPAATGVAGVQDIPTEPVDLGAYGQPIRFEAAPGTAIRVGGTRYAGTIEVRLGPGGDLVVVNEVGMETYVEGIAEMPARWPMEALKAQAVAARTYAWYQMQLGTYGSYDICDSTACQVYAGREVVRTPEVGDRWRRAVRETTGQVLTFEGGPILARYFSTSGGHTFDNEQVFPSEGARPYLEGVPDPDDRVSPLHTWEARFTREQLDTILERGRTLSATVPVADVTRVERAPVLGDLIRVTGRDGTVREVTVADLQSFLNAVAPDLFPEAFPGPRRGISGSGGAASSGDPTSDGQRLPTTVPSRRFRPVVTDDAVVLEGRGWGHGVGMGQYGARGKAERGLDHREILAAYYRGLEPSTPQGLPGSVRVGVSTTGSPVDLTADGPFTVTVGGERITGRGLGSWRVAPGPARTMRLEAPPGYGAPLVVAPTTASRTAPTPVETVRLETVVNKPVELTLEVTGRDGSDVLERSLGVVEPGRHGTVWRLRDADGEPAAGPHRVRLVARDETGTTGGEATTVRVVEPSVPDAPAASLLSSPPPSGLPSAPLTTAALVGAALGVAAALGAARR